MTIVVSTTTGVNRVERLEAGRRTVVETTHRTSVIRDGRGPQGKDGKPGPAGEGVNIDPGDQFILALENAMV